MLPVTYAHMPPSCWCRPPLQVYLSVDALVNRGKLDLIGALLEANSILESLSPDALKARKARQAAERQAAAGGKQMRQIARCAAHMLLSTVNASQAFGSLMELRCRPALL